MNDIGLSLDTVWMLLAAILVFWMLPGFALCEAGLTRSKNTANILMKNFVDFILGSLLYFLVGFGFMFGSDGTGFVGAPNWGDLTFYEGGLPVEGFLMFQTVFCATSATIVSGAMAERTKFSMYLLYSAVISLFIYPIEGHWTWGGGWLNGLGFHDFAGSAIVHSVGGVLALIGALALGPRRGKYGKDGRSRAILVRIQSGQPAGRERRGEPSGHLPCFSDDEPCGSRRWRRHALHDLDQVRQTVPVHDAQRRACRPRGSHGRL